MVPGAGDPTRVAAAVAVCHREIDSLRGLHRDEVMGREAQRPATLEPDRGEVIVDVVEGFAVACDQLDRSWSALTTDDWDRPIVEPVATPTSGPFHSGTWRCSA